MCYFSDDMYRRNNKGKFTQEQSDRIAEIMFPYALQVVLGCATEPSLYKDYVSIVKKAKEMGVPNISLTTNAQLITKEKVKELVASGLSEFTVSVHGVAKETYEKFMPGAKHEVLLEFFQNLKEEKAKTGKEYPKLRVNYTTNPDNLQELNDFYKVYGDYGIDILQLRPVMEIGGVYHKLFDNQEDKDEYKAAVKRLKEESRQQNVMFLANLSDISYSQQSETTPILESVYRYISPNVLWNPDFDWKNEDYFAYSKRIGWGKWLWRNIWSDLGTGEKDESFLKKYSGRYEMVS